MRSSSHDILKEKQKHGLWIFWQINEKFVVTTFLCHCGSVYSVWPNGFQLLPFWSVNVWGVPRQYNLSSIRSHFPSISSFVVRCIHSFRWNKRPCLPTGVFLWNTGRDKSIKSLFDSHGGNTLSLYLGSSNKSLSSYILMVRSFVWVLLINSRTRTRS